MAEKQKKQTQAPPTNVIQLPQSCPVADCKSKPRRAGFCNDHFMWFKEGLVNRKGERPKDFDKKFEAYKRKQAA